MMEHPESTVVLAHHYEREGTKYGPGDMMTLPTDDARALVAAGYAQAYVTPMADDPAETKVTVRAESAGRLTTATGCSYVWPDAGAAIPMDPVDAQFALAMPGFTRADSKPGDETPVSEMVGPADEVEVGF